MIYLNPINKCRLILCLLLFASFISYSQKNPFIRIIPIDKDHFAVENISNFPLMLFIDDVIPNGQLLSQKEEEPYTFSNKQLKPSSTLHIGYTKELYDQQIAYFKRAKENLDNQLDYRLDVDDFLKKIPVGTNDSSRHNRSSDENLDKLLNNVKNGILTFMDFQAIKSYVKSVKRLNKQWDFFDAVYNASENNVQNEYTFAFDDIPIYQIASRASRQSVLPWRYANVAVNLFKSSLGENWSNTGSTRGIANNLSWEASFSHKLFPDINWGGDKFYSGFYLGASYDVFVHDLQNGDKNVFVGAQYVNNSTQDFYRIASEEETTLRTNHFSANIVLHNYIFGGLFFDVGVGYNIIEFGTVHFNRRNNDNDRIDHLSGDAELSNVNFRDAINFDEQDPWYGIVRLGFKSYNRNRAKQKTTNVTAFFSSKLLTRNLLPNDDFQLFEQVEENNFQQISINEGEEFFFQVSLGIGISF